MSMTINKLHGWNVPIFRISVSLTRTGLTLELPCVMQITETYSACLTIKFASGVSTGRYNGGIIFKAILALLERFLHTRSRYVSLPFKTFLRSRYWFKHTRRKYISVPWRRGTLVSACSNVCSQVLSFPLNDNIALTVVRVSSVLAFTLDPTTPLPRDIDHFFSMEQKWKDEQSAKLVLSRRQRRSRLYMELTRSLYSDTSLLYALFLVRSYSQHLTRNFRSAILM